MRCDYALGVGRAFWREFRGKIKAKYPDALLLGEVWDNDVSRLNNYFLGGFDALFDFPWYLSNSGSADTIGEGVINGREPVNLLRSAHLVTQMMYPRGAQLVRFINNHDTQRVASAVNGDPRKMRLAAAQLLLLPGVPMLYYGEEIGMHGIKGRGPTYDEYRREPMDWYATEHGNGMTRWFAPTDRNNRPNDSISVEEEDKNPNSLLNYYRTLSKLRAENASLRGTEFRLVEHVGNCEQCLALWRYANQEATLILFNLSDIGQQIPVDLPNAPVPNGTKLVGNIFPAVAPVPVAAPSLSLGAWEVRVLLWK